MQKSNRLIKKFLRKQKNTTFANVWDAMLDENGRPNQHLFVADNLHMNASGYAIWQKILMPFLLK